MNRSIENFGDAFARKILHDDEFSEYQSHKNKERFLAKRFAAKEAFAKALGTGIVEGVTLPRIQVKNDERGKPYLVLHDSTREKIELLGINRVHLSISDEKEYAIAQVLIEQ
ncbi:MAG: holo-ACP synthase [Kangiellaceae bacterium]|nr:holo-ACP synthase [Kangiellaceae bacterium]